MKCIRLGRSDLKVSQVGLGGFSFGSAGWMVGEDKAREIVKKALDMGINYIDTANIYSKGESEGIIGKIIEGQRDELIISTKVGGKMNEMHAGLSRKEMEYHLKASLKRLRTDYVDVYMTHAWFDHLDTSEVVDILSGMVHDGRARYYGLSNVTGYQLAEAETIASERNLARPELVQNHYNAIYREDERGVIPYCRSKSITFSPFSPLAAGFLTGKYKRGEEPNTVRSREYKPMRVRYFHENDFDILDVVREVSSETGTTPASVSLAYLIAKNCLPVAGISKPEYLQDVEVAMDLELKEDQIRRIDEPYLPHAVMMGTAGYT